MTHFLCNAVYAFGFDEADCESPEPSHVLWTVAGANSAAIFIVVPVNDVMTAILNAPMAPIGGKNAVCPRLLGGLAGDAIGGFKGESAGLFVHRLTFDDECLLNMGEMEIVVEFSGDPDFTGFNAAVISRVIEDEIRLPAVSKVELDIGKECRLVSLNREMVVGLTC